ncbi:MAG: hypothetical protein LBC87_01725 [Fibromonadaceae bacterium]|nr:hypothetical protein [Fibromonadaceae bacterium]
MMVPRDKWLKLFELLKEHDPEHLIGMRNNVTNYLELYVKDYDNYLMDSKSMNAMFYHGLIRKICNALGV